MPAPREARLHWPQRMAWIPILLLIFNRIRQALGCRCQFATVGEWWPPLLLLLLRWCSSFPSRRKILEAASTQSRWEAQMACGKASVLGKGAGSPHECPLSVLFLRHPWAVQSRICCFPPRRMHRM